MNVDWAAPDAAGAHRDPAFPTLAACLAPVVPGAAPVAVYYYPGRTLQVVHDDGAGGLLTRDVPPAVPDVPRPVLRGAAGTGPGEHWDAGLGCVVRRFPHDPGLPVLDPLVRVAGTGADDVLAYLPGARAVLRLGDVVAKVGADRTTVSRNHHRLRALHELPGRGFRIGRPVALDSTRCVRSEVLVGGEPLVRALGRAGVRPGVVAAEVADQVAALHRLDPVGLPLADHGARLVVDRRLRKAVRTIGLALPDLAPQAAALARRLADDVPPPSPVVVHGDLHAANLLVGSDGVTLLDLDELGTGDPELDLAILAGRLLLVGLATGRPDVTSCAVQVVAAYDDVAASPLRPDALRWYLAATLVTRQARTSIRHLAPGLDVLVGRLLALAEAVLDGPAAGDAAGVVRRAAGVASGGLRPVAVG